MVHAFVSNLLAEVIGQVPHVPSAHLATTGLNAKMSVAALRKEIVWKECTAPAAAFATPDIVVTFAKNVSLLTKQSALSCASVPWESTRRCAAALHVVLVDAFKERSANAFVRLAMQEQLAS